MKLKAFGLGLDKSGNPVLQLELEPDVMPWGEFHGRVGVAFAFLKSAGPTIIVVDRHKTEKSKVVDILKEQPEAVIDLILPMKLAKTEEEKRNVILWLKTVAEKGVLVVDILYRSVVFETGLPSHPYAVTTPLRHLEVTAVPESERRKFREIAKLAEGSRR